MISDPPCNLPKSKVNGEVRRQSEVAPGPTAVPNWLVTRLDGQALIGCFGTEVQILNVSIAVDSEQM